MLLNSLRDLGSRRSVAFHPSPLLEGIAAQLVHPRFLKGSDALSCLPPRHQLQFPGRQPLGNRWKCWSWQDCTAHHQVVGSQRSLPPQPVSHLSEGLAPLAADPVHFSCSASLCDSFLGRGHGAAGAAPPLGLSLCVALEPLLCRIRAVKWWVQEQGCGGSSAAVLCPCLSVSLVPCPGVPVLWRAWSG